MLKEICQTYFLLRCLLETYTCAIKIWSSQHEINFKWQPIWRSYQCTMWQICDANIFPPIFEQLFMLHFPRTNVIGIFPRVPSSLLPCARRKIMQDSLSALYSWSWTKLLVQDPDMWMLQRPTINVLKTHFDWNSICWCNFWGTQIRDSFTWTKKQLEWLCTLHQGHHYLQLPNDPHFCVVFTTSSYWWW